MQNVAGYFYSYFVSCSADCINFIRQIAISKGGYRLADHPVTSLADSEETLRKENVSNPFN